MPRKSPRKRYVPMPGNAGGKMMPSWVMAYSSRPLRAIVTAQAYKTNPDLASGKVLYAPMVPGTYANPKWVFWANTTTLYSMSQVVITGSGGFTFTLSPTPPTGTIGYLIVLANHRATMDKFGSTCGGSIIVTASA
jgi:hypothetical protein